MNVPHSRPAIDQDDIAAVSRILASGRLAQGERVREFENQIAHFIGVKHAVACSSGTAALHLALLSLEVSTKDEIIMPSYVCSSPYFAAVHAGAKPKIVDIDPEGLNICAKTAKKHVTFKTKAIVVPHMFGNPAELDELLSFGVPVIEDCAQALGAEYSKRKVGSFGDLSIFSFYATKMITTGEGGMVLTNSRMDYSRIIEARDYDKKVLFPAKYNYKMTDFQAALGLSQLKKLQAFIRKRRKIASLYSGRFSDLGVTIPSNHSHKKSVFYRYVIMVDKPDKVRNEARNKGVICEKPVWKPIHQQLRSVKCPNTDYVCDHALSIPIYPSLNEEEIEHVTATLEKALGKQQESNGPS